MTSVAHTLGEFIAAWNAGERPRLDDYVSRVPPHEQDDLAQQIRMFMLDAPEPEYSEAAWTELTSDPMIAQVAARAMEPEPWPSLLPRLRERAGLSVAAVVEGLGISAGKRDKAAELYGEMESGKLDPTAPTKTLLERLAKVLGIGPESLDWRGHQTMGESLRSFALPAPAAAPALLRSSAEEDDDAPAEHSLDVLADALTTDADEPDEVDELFLGGRE